MSFYSWNRKCWFLWRYKKNMIWLQPLTAWTDWFVTRNGESIKCVVWHLVLNVWSNRIRYFFNFINICYKNVFFNEFMRIELFMNKDVSKTDETLQDECIFKCRKCRKYKIYRVASCFNRVIELNQKMLILSTFLTKYYFLCDDDNWIA